MLNRQNLFGKRDERVDALTARPPVLDNRPAPAVTVRPATGANGASVPAPGTTAAAAAANEAAKSDKPRTEVTGSRLIVGPDVKLKGAEILDCDTLVVEGRVEATMDSRVIHIAENGAFSGKVSIDVAEIHGNFEGELTVRSQLLIHSTGRVNGKIRYGKILIDEGGQLSGDVQSLSAAENRAPAIAA
ncbi:MAG: cell shape determination protein CcmA [Candidatus Accumulibacter sp. 66-26]|nr:polymer-forming cytoskeletal protein [Accumulibacter sp.]OJW50455.1 MAG: cell shape determination protein CcmA [Candidatus Accumulibacter sp. 66-26]